MQQRNYEDELTHHTHQQNGTESQFHDAYEAAVDSVQSDLGATHPLRIDGEAVTTDDSFVVKSPGDFDLEIGEFAAGEAAEVEAAVDVASAAHPDWEDRDPSSRTEVFTTAADLLRDRKYEIRRRALPRKRQNRTEAMADVDEAIDSSSPTASRIPIGS